MSVLAQLRIAKEEKNLVLPPRPVDAKEISPPAGPQGETVVEAGKFPNVDAHFEIRKSEKAAPSSKPDARTACSLFQFRVTLSADVEKDSTVSVEVFQDLNLSHKRQPKDQNKDTFDVAQRATLSAKNRTFVFEVGRYDDFDPAFYIAVSQSKKGRDGKPEKVTAATKVYPYLQDKCR